jgi:hypothetical protein
MQTFREAGLPCQKFDRVARSILFDGVAEVVISSVALRSVLQQEVLYGTTAELGSAAADK